MFVLDDNATENWVEGNKSNLIVHIANADVLVVLESAYVYIKDHDHPIEVKPTLILLKMNKK